MPKGRSREARGGPGKGETMSDSKQKNEKTLFQCVWCSAQFLLDFIPPEEWTVQRYAEMGHFKFTCENCGAFIYPADLSRGETPDEDTFYMFAGCVNAYDCHMHHQYDPSCEKPLLKPKCLHALYMELANIHYRLDEMEKRSSGKQALGQGFMDGGRKPGTKLN